MKVLRGCKNCNTIVNAGLHVLLSLDIKDLLLKSGPYEVLTAVLLVLDRPLFLMRCNAKATLQSTNGADMAGPGIPNALLFFP